MKKNPNEKILWSHQYLLYLLLVHLTILNATIPCTNISSVCICRPANNGLELTCVKQSYEAVFDYFNVLYKPNLIKEITIQDLSTSFPTLTEKSFQRFTSLTKLNFNNVSIQIISQNAFRSLKHLKTLIIDKNPGIKFHPEAFTDAYISNFSYTMSEVTNISSISKLSELEILNFESNYIEHITYNTFKTTTKLKQIILKKNRISQIEDGAFHLSQLETLDLSNNSIRLLPEDIFQNLLQLKRLNLKGNPIQCDCQMYRFIKWIQNNTNLTEKENLGQCQATDQYLVDVEIEKCLTSFQFTNSSTHQIDYNSTMEMNSTMEKRNITSTLYYQALSKRNDSQTIYTISNYCINTTNIEYPNQVNISIWIYVTPMLFTLILITFCLQLCYLCSFKKCQNKQNTTLLTNQPSIPPDRNKPTFSDINQHANAMNSKCSPSSKLPKIPSRTFTISNEHDYQSDAYILPSSVKGPERNQNTYQKQPTRKYSDGSQNESYFQIQ